MNALRLIGGTVAVLALVVATLRLRHCIPDVAVLTRTLRNYADLVPWMLRLSVGLPLVGAGFTWGAGPWSVDAWLGADHERVRWRL